MGNFFSRLFLGESGKIATQAVADSAKASFEIIDEAFDTDQEKREAKQKIIPLLIQAHQTTANDGNAEARFWFLQQITNFTFGLAAMALVAELANRHDVVVTILDIADKFYLGWAFFAAVSFFFRVDVSAASGIKMPGFKKG